MSGTETGRVTSADGTSIVFDRSGTGPAVVLVHGAFTGRAHPSCLKWRRFWHGGSPCSITTAGGGETAGTPSPTPSSARPRTWLPSLR